MEFSCQDVPTWPNGQLVKGSGSTDIRPRPPARAVYAPPPSRRLGTTQIHHQVAVVEKTGPGRGRLVLMYQGTVGKGKEGDGSCGVCHRTKVHSGRSAKGWAGFPGHEIANGPPDQRGRLFDVLVVRSPQWR